MALLYGGIAAVGATLWLCGTTLELLSWTSGSAPLQEEPPVGAPLPTAFAWRSATVQVVTAFGSIPALATAAIALVLAASASFALCRRLNPTFQPVTVMPMGGTILTRSHLDAAVIAKLVTLAAFSGMPILSLWSLAVRPGATDLTTIVLCALSGATAWALLARDGVAGDFREGAYLWPGRALWSLAARGALAGLAVAAYVAVGRQVDPGAELAFRRSLGAIGEGSWWHAAAHVVVTWVLATAALGALLAALATPGRSSRVRAIAGAPAAFVLVGILLFEAHWLPEYRRTRFDFEAGAGLADRATHLRTALGLATPPPSPPVLFVEPDGTAASLPVSLASPEGLDARPDAAARIEAFLQQRGHRTATSRAAMHALLSGAAARWDQAEAIRLCLMALERFPDLDTLAVLLDLLRSSAATPEAALAVDAFGDPRRFQQTDRLAAALIGDLHARLGRRVQAAEWYDRAGMPPTRILQRLQTRTMFARGEVRGRILLRGAPAAHTRVGVLPVSDWPPTGEALTLKRPMEAGRMRFVCASASTDSEGRFRIRGLIAGRYRLVVAPKAGSVPAYVWLTARGARGDLFVGFARPVADAGTIDLREGPPTP